MAVYHPMFSFHLGSDWDRIGIGLTASIVIALVAWFRRASTCCGPGNAGRSGAYDYAVGQSNRNQRAGRDGDDGSRDDTLKMLKKLAKADKAVKVISFSRNFGHQEAVSAGMAKCKGKAIIVIDCDLQELIDRWLSVFSLVSPFAGEPIRDQDGIIAETMASGSTAANPRPVSAENVVDLLQMVFQLD